MHHNNYHFWFILRSTWMYHYSIIHLLIYQPRSLTTRLSISCTVFNLALMFFPTEINICSTLKEMRNLCIFGIERHCHTFLIISRVTGLYIHCKPVKQTVWIVTCRNDPLWASLKNYIDLAQIYSTVKTVPFCTKLILKIYTHTAYFTYSIANLRKRSVVSTHFPFPLKAFSFS